MTIEELEKMGIYHISGSKISPRRFHVEDLNTTMQIPESMTIRDLVFRIYEDSYNLGVSAGQIEKQNEIKEVLGL